MNDESDSQKFDRAKHRRSGRASCVLQAAWTAPNRPWNG